MVKEEVDWKNQRQRALDWLAVGLAVVLVGLYGTIWLRLGEQEPLVLAAFLVGWVAVYFSRYWQPILYPLAAIVMGGSVVVDLLTGIPDVPFFWVVVAVTVVFVADLLFLFKREESADKSVD